MGSGRAAMGTSRSDWTEVEALLNAEAERKSRRRKPHHLPDECYSTLEAIYGVTLCARHHGAPFAYSGVARDVVAALRYYHERRLWTVYAYCLMPDHLHVVLRLLEAELGDVARGGSPAIAPFRGLKELVSRFKRYTTTQIAWKHGLHGKLWQRDFYDHIARDGEDAERQCRYVLDNPVRKGLVEVWSDYPWSGSMETWKEDV
jgi:REP-associated tyrosine transposase